MLYESRQAAMNIFNDYSLIASEVKHKERYGGGLKILSPKQMLQRLPIAMAQVKAGKTSEKLTKWNQANYIFFVLNKRNY